MSERCGLGEGTHYGCECVMRRIADLESALSASEARAKELERERDEARRDARATVEANRLFGDEAVILRTDLATAEAERDEARRALRRVLDSYDGSGQRYIGSAEIRAARAALAATPDARPDPRDAVIEAALALVARVDAGGLIAFGTLDTIRTALAALPASPQATTPAPEKEDDRG
jgi:hypothetical protein